MKVPDCHPLRGRICRVRFRTQNTEKISDATMALSIFITWINSLSFFLSKKILKSLPLWIFNKFVFYKFYNTRYVVQTQHNNIYISKLFIECRHWTHDLPRQVNQRNDPLDYYTTHIILLRHFASVNFLPITLTLLK